MFFLLIALIEHPATDLSMQNFYCYGKPNPEPECWKEENSAEGYAKLSFNGTRFAVYGVYDSKHGEFNVTLDGQFLAKVSQKNDQRIFNVEQFISPYFPYDSHTLTLSSYEVFSIVRIVIWTEEGLPVPTPVPTPAPCIYNWVLKVNATVFIDHYDQDDGGIINLTNGGIYVANTKFINCSSSKQGGAIFLNNPKKACPVMIVRSTFSHCRADNGGAITLIQN